jgi:hypothetical protein
VTALLLPKSVHIEGNIEPTGVDMSSQNPRLYGRFVETRLPELAIRVGEVPGSNPGAPICSWLDAGRCWSPLKPSHLAQRLGYRDDAATKSEFV